MRKTLKTLFKAPCGAYVLEVRKVKNGFSYLWNCCGPSATWEECGRIRGRVSASAVRRRLEGKVTDSVLDGFTPRRLKHVLQKLELL